MTSLPFVSIIVPTYNDSNRLQKCLRLLEDQTYPIHLYEVIVIDNNSSEEIESIVAQFSKTAYIFESVPGSYSARNKGISVAKGEILGFTDSDCAPALDWIEQGVAQMLTHPGCGFVAGRINFSFSDPDDPTPAELYDSLHFLQQEKYVREGHFGVTANLFTTPQVFETVGLFNSALQSGGDREWGKRVHTAGYAQIYATDVIVAHPARADFKELSRKLCRVHQGEFKMKNQARMPFPQFVYQLLLDLKPPARYLMKILTNDDIKSIRKRIFVVYIYMYLRVKKAIVKAQLYWA